jgi:hypothetical protein
MTLGLYAQMMSVANEDRERLCALVEGAESAPIGTGGDPEGSRPEDCAPVADPENPALQGHWKMGAAGFEPATSRV